MLHKNNTSPSGQTLSGLFHDEPDRARRWTRRLGPLLVDVSRRHLHEERLGAMLAQARQAGLPAAIGALFAGDVVNPSENQPALHWALRAPRDEIPDPSLAREWEETHERMAGLAEQVRRGEWRGATGQPVSDVLCLGIGGSQLGARLAVSALGPGDGPRLHFVGSFGGRRLTELLGALDPAGTLVLATSKSFTTAETLHNAGAVRDWLGQSLPEGADAKRHLVAITARPEAAVEFGVPEEQVLPMWEAVGGRFSLWSAAGLPVALALGSGAFEALGEGAWLVDEHFRDAEPAESLPLLLGALDLERPAMAVVPYDERLALLPEYLMQLYMESLGKGVSARGSEIPNYRAPLVFGSTGTQAQHAFFQALHQANLEVTVELLGVIRPGHERPDDHRMLLANLLSQASAMAFGWSESEVRTALEERGLPSEAIDAELPHRVCPGNRPSNVVLMDDLEPRSLGALLALYEHRVFAAGSLAGINPFDQFGVELGKRLAGDVERILAGDSADVPLGLEQLVRAIRAARQ